MSVKHKWYNEIVAWANGAQIEYKDKHYGWIDVKEPSWITNHEYRIKPQPKEPQYLYIYLEPETGNYKFNKSMIKIYAKFYIGKIKLEVGDEPVHSN